MSEGLVHIPQRTGSAGAGKMEIRRRLALRNIAGAVDADEEERHASRVVTLQGAQAVANRLKTHAKPMPEQFDIVTAPFGFREEDRIRQDQRTGKIVRKSDACEAAGFLA